MQRVPEPRGITGEQRLHISDVDECLRLLVHSLQFARWIGRFLEAPVDEYLQLVLHRREQRDERQRADRRCRLGARRPVISWNTARSTPLIATYRPASSAVSGTYTSVRLMIRSMSYSP